DEVYSLVRDLPHSLNREADRARQAAAELARIGRDHQALAASLAELQGHEQTITRSLQAVEARLDGARRFISESEAAAGQAVHATPQYVAARQPTDAARADMEAAIATANARLE